MDSIPTCRLTMEIPHMRRDIMMLIQDRAEELRADIRLAVESAVLESKQNLETMANDQVREHSLSCLRTEIQDACYRVFQEPEIRQAIESKVRALILEVIK